MPSNITITETEYHEHCDNYDGVCLKCEEWTAGSVEPDAENYLCDSCGAHAVVGCEQALIMDRLTITD